MVLGQLNQRPSILRRPFIFRTIASVYETRNGLGELHSLMKKRERRMGSASALASEWTHAFERQRELEQIRSMRVYLRRCTSLRTASASASVPEVDIPLRSSKAVLRGPEARRVERAENTAATGVAAQFVEESQSEDHSSKTAKRQRTGASGSAAAAALPSQNDLLKMLSPNGDFDEFKRLVTTHTAEMLEFIKGGHDGLPLLTILQKPIYCNEELNSEIVEYLISRKADINQQGKDDGKTALHTAACLRWEDNLTLLLDCDADPNICDSKGASALTLASANGRASFVEELIDAKADLNVQDVCGRTPLMCAAHLSNENPGSRSVASLEVVKMLVGAGCDTAPQNKDGLTALHLARKSLQTKEIEAISAFLADETQMTLERESLPSDDKLLDLLEIDCFEGSTRKFQNFKELFTTPRSKMRERIIGHGPAEDMGEVETKRLADGKIEVVKFLISQQANLNMPGKSGETALHAAINHHEGEIFDLLLASKANPDVCNDAGVTPLISASCLGIDHCAKQLIQHRADLNAQESKGLTALMSASYFGIYADRYFAASFEIAKMLVSAGCDTEMKDHEGLTALDFAKKDKNGKFFTKEVQKVKRIVAYLEEEKQMRQMQKDLTETKSHSPLARK
eukprot:jgi/Bigna1/89693/estExt_fgenesh1_pg.C_530131